MSKRFRGGEGTKGGVVPLGALRLAPDHSSTDRLLCKGMRWELGQAAELKHGLL